MQTLALSTTPAETLSIEDRAIIDGFWCIVGLTTENSHYTLVKRQALVVVVKDVATGPAPIVKEGDVMTGVGAKVLDNGCLYVWDADGRMVFQSSRIRSAYVMEN
jgi:hypothetical protein